MELRIFCDGGARRNPGPAAGAFVVKNEKNEVLRSGGKFLGVATNNQAEYAAVETALRDIYDHEILRYCPADGGADIRKITFFLDSTLVANQLSGKFKIKNKNLQKMVIVIKEIERELKNRFAGLEIFYVIIPREQNFEADKIVNKILDDDLGHDSHSIPLQNG